MPADKTRMRVLPIRTKDGDSQVLTEMMFPDWGIIPLVGRDEYGEGFTDGWGVLHVRTGITVAHPQKPSCLLHARAMGAYLQGAGFDWSTVTFSGTKPPDDRRARALIAAAVKLGMLCTRPRCDGRIPPLSREGVTDLIRGVL